MAAVDRGHKQGALSSQLPSIPPFHPTLMKVHQEDNYIEKNQFFSTEGEDFF